VAFLVFFVDFLVAGFAIVALLGAAGAYIEENDGLVSYIEIAWSSIVTTGVVGYAKTNDQI
jgi:hypothetical protein